MKVVFILLAEETSFSKATMFLSHQIVQKRQRRASSHTLFHFFPTQAPCQEIRVWRTEERGTHLVPKMARTDSWRIPALWQWTRRCSTVSSSSSQRRQPYIISATVWLYRIGQRPAHPHLKALWYRY